MARMSTVDLSRKDKWAINPAVSADSPIHWDGGALVADLEGEGDDLRHVVDRSVLQEDDVRVAPGDPVPRRPAARLDDDRDHGLALRGRADLGHQLPRLV